MEDNKMEEGEAAKGIRDLEGPKVNKEVHNTKEAEEGTEIQYTKSTVATPPPQLPEPLSQPLPNTQRPFEDIWRSLKQLINDTNTEYRAAKEKMPDILPVLRKEQVEVKDEQGPADPRFKGGDLLVDETPRFLYINNPLSIPPRLWASQFTRSCYWMSSSPYEAHIERLQSLYCFGVDEDSPVECRLRDGDQGSWKLCSVLVAPALATQSQADQTLQGGIIYHYGKAGTLGDNGFLAGELRCALTILASQLRSKRQSQLRSQDIDFDFGQHLQKCHVRIVSIFDTQLRVLDIRYDPYTEKVSCRILASIDLDMYSTERIGDGELQQLDTDWVQAIRITLELKKKDEEYREE